MENGGLNVFFRGIFLSSFGHFPADFIGFQGKFKHSIENIFEEKRPKIA